MALVNPLSTMLNIPTFDDVGAASERIREHAHRTPVLTSSAINEELGAEIFLKCENLQRAGAFKFRGAFNALAKLGVVERRAGVVTFSSGNHAQALALAAQLLGISATVIMPRDAPATKIAATKEYGGHILLYDRFKEDREKMAAALAGDRGLALIPPYDHPDVIAGQGTAAKELFEVVGVLDALFVPVGGGGLLAGSALAAHGLAPSCRLFGVEPEAGNDAQQSLRAGSIVHIDTPRTIADGAQTQRLGQLTFPIIKHHVEDILTVTDAQLIDGMHFLAARMKLVVEPTGCLGFAGLRANKSLLRNKRIGVIVSGGNVDLRRFCALLAGAS
jgi:threo-3-hydroxy-L-aspartate ammonia-lyase